MSRQQFRLLLVINQILMFASYPLGAIADTRLPPEVAGQFGADRSVMEGYAGGGSLFDGPLYLLPLALTFATLAAAVGLFYGRRWGRTLYVVCFAAALAVAALTPFYLSVGWESAVAMLYSLTEGMILGLVYFSHLRRMFARRGEADDGEDEE
jgi:hypothetical protein